MVAKKSHGASIPRMLPAVKHEVCCLGETLSKIISDIAFAEYGHADVTVKKVNSHVDRLFAGVGDEMPAFMSHFDKLVSLPAVSNMRIPIYDTLIDLNRDSWSLLPPRTPSTLVSLTRRSPSLVRLFQTPIFESAEQDANAM